MYDANAWVSLIFLSVILVLPGSFVLGRHSKDQGINYSAKDVAKFFLALAAIGLFLTLMWSGGWQLNAVPLHVRRPFKEVQKETW
jgi:hypothetical protein